MGVTIGWDVGGAHLKAARAENGRVVAAVQAASPLWLGVFRLDEAFEAIKKQLGPADRHAVAMTGELSMAFASRREGVRALTAAVIAHLAPVPIRFYGGRAGLLTAEAVADHAADVASANWHASAAITGRHCRDALFIDMGSTTTDLIPIVDGVVAARGYTDAERLATGELVYAGLVRSMVFASTNRAPVGGAWTPLMNDDFANMADVHRLIDDLPVDADVQATTDGRDKSLAASRARLARMVGRDADDLDDDAWLRLAEWFAEQQLRVIADAAAQVLSVGRLARDAPIVAAGTGCETLRKVSRRLGRRHIDFGELVGAMPETRMAATHHAPAAALAILATSLQPADE
jgi:(4-(4-[2-(gamma-L-glutamylamino)ethyl]phenoxymethyl)furan-2-yl)methanamine synthase